MTAQELLLKLLEIPEEKRSTTEICKWDNYYEATQPIDEMEADEDYPDSYILR